ncbi:MAG: PAS domain-containing sensor histidine kinase [Gammaproteobacteria bacterium]
MTKSSDRDDSPPSDMQTRLHNEVLHRERLKRDLHTSEQRFRNLVESSLQGVFVHRDWQLLFANQALADMLGYDSPEAVLALCSPRAFIAPYELERLQKNLQSRLQGIHLPSYEYDVVRQDGTVITLQNQASLVDWAGESAVQVAVIDVTERKRAYQELEHRVAERTRDLSETNALLRQEIQQRKRIEAELEQERSLLSQRIAERTAALHEANINLLAAARAKDEFLTTMSHELRTPLNAIMGFAEVLLSDLTEPLAKEQQRYIGIIYDSGKQLLSLINDILDVAQLESGTMQLELTDVNIAAICQASLRLIQPMAAQKQQMVSVQIDPAVESITADERALRQILHKLLNNAVKFTLASGYIGLECNTDPATATMAFTVWDNGIGIAEQERERLFQPFVQLRTGLRREHGGAGLGLVLVDKLVKLHGGKIAVHSTPGEGSRFTITLPQTGPPRIV